MAMMRWVRFLDFFFQAEDGIRDADVTGVQTCALPISRKQGQPIDRWILGLAQQEIGDWTEKDSASGDPQLFRAPKFRQGLRRAEPEFHSLLELRHDVVIVRVEPLGHLLRPYFPPARPFAAADRRAHA